MKQQRRDANTLCGLLGEQSDRCEKYKKQAECFRVRKTDAGTTARAQTNNLVHTHQKVEHQNASVQQTAKLARVTVKRLSGRVGGGDRDLPRYVFLDSL